MKLNRPMIGRLILTLLAVAAWFVARERLERKWEAAEKTDRVRLLQIKRVREENARLRESARDEVRAREVAEGDPAIPARRLAAVEREIGVREVAELRRLGLVAIVGGTAAVAPGGRTRFPFAPFDGGRGRLAPAFVETFGLSTEEVAELQAAYDRARSKILAMGAGAVTTRWEADGGLVIEAKRAEESQVYMSELKEAFMRAMGAERFALYDGLAGDVVLTDGNIVLRATGFDAPFMSWRLLDEQVKITRRSEGGVVGYELANGGHDGGWRASLPPMSRAALLSRLGELGRHVPPDF